VSEMVKVFKVGDIYFEVDDNGTVDVMIVKSSRVCRATLVYDYIEFWDFVMYLVAGMIASHRFGNVKRELITIHDSLDSICRKAGDEGEC